MSDNLKDIISKAKDNGASLEQIVALIEMYNKKKDLSESPFTGEEETTNTDSTPSVERDYPTPPTFITEKKLPRQDKAPVEYKPSFTEEERNAIYDEAGVPESQRPDRGDGVSLVIEKFALEAAARDRRANQAAANYEGLFESFNLAGAHSGYIPPRTTRSEKMSEEELSFAKENTRKEINQVMGFEESTSFEDGIEAVRNDYSYQKSVLAEIALERAKEERRKDDSEITVTEQVGRGLGVIAWAAGLSDLPEPESSGDKIGGFFNAALDPITKKIGANAAIAWYDATNQPLKAEQVDLIKKEGDLKNMLQVGLDPDDTRGITETLEEGEKGLAALKFAYYGSQSVGLMAATVIQPEIGIALMATSSGLETYGGFRDRLDLSAEDKATLAISAGATEVLMGKLLGGVGNVRRFRKAIGVSDDIANATLTQRRAAYNKALDFIEPYSKKVKDVLSTPAARAGGRLVYDTSAEAVEELGVEITNQLFAHAIAGEEFNPYALADATLLGGGMGKAMGFVSAMKSYNVESSFYNKPLSSDMEKYEELQTMYTDLKQAAREETDPAKRKIILEEAKKVRSEGQDLIRKANQAYDKLSYDERAELSGINKNITNAIDSVKNATNKTVKNRKKNELAGLLVRKSVLESKAGLDLQISESQIKGLNEIEAKTIAEEKATKVKGVPLMSAMQMVEDLKLKRQERVKEAESRERSSESPIENSLNKRVRYLNPATNETVEGVLSLDGQSLVVETDEGNIIEVGVFENLKGRSHESLDVSAAQGLLEVNEDGSFTYAPVAGTKGAGQGTKMYNRNGVKAIRRDKNGNIKNVLLTNEDGSRTYNLKGAEAEEAAYQILLKETQTPEGKKRVDEALNQSAEDKKVLEESKTQSQKKEEKQTSQSEAQPESQTEAQPETKQKVIGAEQLSVEANAQIARFMAVISKVAPNQSIEILDSQEAVISKWKQLGGNPSKKPRSFNDPKTQTIYVSKDLLTNLRRGDGKMIVRHEFLHPIVNVLFSSDPSFRQLMVDNVLSILNSIPNTNPAKRAVFNHARKYNSPAQYAEELVVEFFNQFSIDSNFDTAMKANPSLMQRLVNMLNDLLSRFTDFKFTVKDTNSAKQALKSIKESFDNAMPFDADVLQKNMDTGLQAYMQGDEADETSDWDDLNLDNISEISANNAQWNEAANNSLTANSIEMMKDSHRELLESFGFFGTGVIGKNNGEIFIRKAVQSKISPATLIDKSDFLDDEQTKSLDKDLFGGLTKKLGINVVYINKPEIDLATTLLMPTTRTGLKEPTIAINIAKATEETQFYGMGAYIVDVVRNLNSEVIGSIYRRYQQFTQKLDHERYQSLVSGNEIQGEVIQMNEYEYSFLDQLHRKMIVNSGTHPNLSIELTFVQALSEIVSEELINIQSDVSSRADAPLSVDEILEGFFTELSARAAGSEKAAAAQIIDVRGYSAAEIIFRMFVGDDFKVTEAYKQNVSRTNDIRRKIIEGARDYEKGDKKAISPEFKYELRHSLDNSYYNLDTVKKLGDERSVAAMEFLSKMYSEDTLKKVQAKKGSQTMRDDQILKREALKLNNWYNIFSQYKGGDFNSVFASALDRLSNFGNAGFSEDNFDNRHYIHSIIADNWVLDGYDYYEVFHKLFEGDINEFFEGKIELTLSESGKTLLGHYGIDINEETNKSMLHAIKSAMYRPVVLRDYIQQALDNVMSGVTPSSILMTKIKEIGGEWAENLIDGVKRDYNTSIAATGNGLRDVNLKSNGEMIVVEYKYSYKAGFNNIEEVEEYRSIGVADEAKRHFRREPVTPTNNLSSSEIFGYQDDKFRNDYLKKHWQTFLFSNDTRRRTHESVYSSLGLTGRKAVEYGIFTQEEVDKYIKRQNFDGIEIRVKYLDILKKSPIPTWSLLQVSNNSSLKDNLTPTDGDLSTIYKDLFNHFQDNLRKSTQAGGSKFNTIYDVLDTYKSDPRFETHMTRLFRKLSSKDFTVDSDAAPEDLKTLHMSVHAVGGNVSFGVDKWGSLNRALASSYANIPSSWGYSRKVSKEVNTFLEEIAKELPTINQFYFSAVSSNFIDKFDPRKIEREITNAEYEIKSLKDALKTLKDSLVNPPTEQESKNIERLNREIDYNQKLIDTLESRKDYTYSENELKVQSNFLRKSLYNAWATKMFGGSLHLKSRAIELFKVSDNEYYIVSNNSQDKKAFPNLFMHPKKARNIFQSARSKQQVFLDTLQDLKDEGNAPAPLTESDIEAIVKYFGFPSVESYSTEKKYVSLGRSLQNISYTYDASSVNISEIIKTLGSDKGVFDFIADPVKPSELQAYMEGATDGSDVIEALEDLREDEKAIIEGYTKKRPFSLDNIKGRIFNRYQGLRDAINSGLSAYTRSLLTKRTGYAMYADKMFRDYDEKIFKGLSVGQEVLLDDIIHLRRVVQIDTNFDQKREKIEKEINIVKIHLSALDKKGLLNKEDKKQKTHLKKELKLLKINLDNAKRPLHPTPPSFKGKLINKEEAIKGLAAYEARMTPKEFEKLSKRADAYFDAHRDMLAYARDVGLINEETYDRFSSDDYSPRIFLEKMFGDSPDHTFRGTKLDDDYIKSIKNGSNLAMFTDARQLLSLSLRSIRTKDIQNQLIKSMHNDAKKKNYAGVDFMKPLNTKTVKGKTTTTPADKGFVNVFYRVDGELEGFQIKAELYPQLTGNVKNYIEVPSTAKKVIRAVLGVPILKTLATGVNTAFALTAAMRFVPEAVLGRGTYDKYRFLPLMAAAATIDILSAAKDAIFNKDLVEEYLSSGGETIWMSSYGRPESAIKRKNRSLLAATTNKIARSGFDKISWAANKSELAARLALYKRAKENLTREFGDKLNEEQIRSLAVEEAIMLADFSTSGTLSKDIDMVSPYFNPAVQGFRGAASYIKSNPKAAASKLGQFFASSFAIQLVAMLSMDDDEWDRISSYQKQMYLHIPIGRNKDGDMRTLKLPRAHTFLPVSSLATIMAQHARDIIRGKEIKADKNSKDYKSFEDGRYLIESIMRGMPVPSAAPLINAYMVVQHNIDMWRGQEVNYENDDVRNYVKGLYDENVRDFYKYIALKSYDVGFADVSPRTMQTAVEKFITNDRNFLVDQSYKIADVLAIHGGKLDKLMDKHGIDYKSIDKEKTKIINSLFGVKGRIYTIPKVKVSDSKRVKDIALEKNTKMFKMKKNIRESAIEYSKKETTVSTIPKEVLEKINSMTDNVFERKALMSWWKYYYRGKLVPTGIADVMFSQSAVEKLAKIEEIVGDVSELDNQDYLELMTQLATAGMRKDAELNKLISDKRKK